MLHRPQAVLSKGRRTMPEGASWQQQGQSQRTLLWRWPDGSLPSCSCLPLLLLLLLPLLLCRDYGCSGGLM
jgi:hypothetical protein